MTDEQMIIREQIEDGWMDRKRDIERWNTPV